MLCCSSQRNTSSLLPPKNCLRVNSVCTVELLVPTNNDALCHIIHMSEDFGTRPLILYRFRCTRSQITQLQKAFGAGELVSDIHGILFFMDREDKTGEPRRLSFFVFKVRHPSEAKDVNDFDFYLFVLFASL